MTGVSPRGLVELRRYLDTFWGDVLQAFKAAAERETSRGRRAGKEKKRRTHGR